MRVHIKEWPNNTATIMTEHGQVIWTFSGMAEARRACAEWQSIIHYEVIEELPTGGSGTVTCAFLV